MIEELPIEYQVTCKICQANFLSEHDTANVCSPVCRRAAERTRERAKRARRKQRLALAAGLSGTGVANKTTTQIIALAERDGRNCALCGKPVDITMQDLLHDKAPSRDHKHPKSRGGKSGIDNLQLAHRICNIRRGNSLIGQKTQVHKKQSKKRRTKKKRK